MEPQILSDALLLAAPAIGTVANIAFQFTLYRMTRSTLMISIMAGLGAGCAVTAAFVALALFLSPPTIVDGCALALSVFVIYGAAGMTYFSLINLGETSLRIRMLQLLLDSPNGLTLPEILAIYDDKKLIATRLRRMAENRRAILIDGVVYPRRSVLFAASWVLELLKRLLYGRDPIFVSCRKGNDRVSRVKMTSRPNGTSIPAPNDPGRAAGGKQQ